MSQSVLANRWLWKRGNALCSLLLSSLVVVRDTADLGVVGFLFVRAIEHPLDRHPGTYPHHVNNSLLMHKLSTV